MKKILSTVVVCVLLLSCVLAFAGCKTISGEYTDALSITTYKFSGSKVTITIDNIIGEDTVIEGKYSIDKNEEGDFEITFTFEGEDDGEEYAGTFSFSEGKEENGTKYIKIAGIKYTKK